MECRLLELLNDIVNEINMIATRYNINNCRTFNELENTTIHNLLPCSLEVRHYGKNVAVSRYETVAKKLIIEEAKEKKVFK